MPAVLAISLLLILAQTAGAFYIGSFLLFAYAALITALSFSLLPVIINIYDTGNESFRRVQLVSLLINSVVLLLLSLFITYRAIISFSLPYEINILLMRRFIFSGFAALIICSIILFAEMKNDKDLKTLFFKYFFASMLSFFVIIASIVYLKDLYFLDLTISIVLLVPAIAQTIILIRKSIKYLRKK